MNSKQYQQQMRGLMVSSKRIQTAAKSAVMSRKSMRKASASSAMKLPGSYSINDNEHQRLPVTRRASLGSSSGSEYSSSSISDPQTTMNLRRSGNNADFCTDYSYTDKHGQSRKLRERPLVETSLYNPFDKCGYSPYLPTKSLKYNNDNINKANRVLKAKKVNKEKANCKQWVSCPKSAESEDEVAWNPRDNDWWINGKSNKNSKALENDTLKNSVSDNVKTREPHDVLWGEKDYDWWIPDATDQHDEHRNNDHQYENFKKNQREPHDSYCDDKVDDQLTSINMNSANEKSSLSRDLMICESYENRRDDTTIIDDSDGLDSAKLAGNNSESITDNAIDNETKGADVGMTTCAKCGTDINDKNQANREPMPHRIQLQCTKRMKIVIESADEFEVSTNGQKAAPRGRRKVKNQRQSIDIQLVKSSSSSSRRGGVIRRAGKTKAAVADSCLEKLGIASFWSAKFAHVRRIEDLPRTRCGRRIKVPLQSYRYQLDCQGKLKLVAI